MHAAWTSSGAVLLYTTASCAQLWGFRDGTLDVAGVDAATADSAGPDVDAALPVDLTLPVPTTCETRTADLDAIFVDASASQANETCSAAAPCRSIQRALAQVTESRHVVYVGRGRYDESLQVSPALLGAGLRIEGRWEHGSSGWAPYCAAEADLQIVTTLEVGSNDLDADAGRIGVLQLAYVVVVGRPPEGEATSSYGIVARNAHVVLIGARVLADRGESGFSAGEIDRPAPAAGQAECTLETASTGAPGQSGAALGTGAYTPDGFVAASTPNRAAGPGSQGSCAGCTSTGAGGAPGRNGEGGGASVAVYLWDALLEVTEGSTLAALGGGNGGNGGPGGLGASGVCSGTPATGGAGGTGSPGAGGPTACIVQAGARSVGVGGTADTCTLPTFAAAGGAGGEGVQAAAGRLAVVD